MPKGENRIIRRRIVNAYLSSVISISLVLLLVGVASMLMVNTHNVSDFFKENMTLQVLMKQEVTDSQADVFRAGIEKMDFIKSAELITKEQGEMEMTRMLGDDFLDIFETSPVPVSVDVSVVAEYVSADSLSMICGILERDPLVDEVVFQRSLVDTLNTNMRKISIVLTVFIALMLVISFALISNMMRLSVYDKRFSIHTMRLVGATKAFIRGPFLAKAAFLGLFAAFLAILMIVVGLYFLRREFVQLFEIFTIDLLIEVMGIVVAFGLVICVLSTYFVVDRLVGMGKEELYA